MLVVEISDESHREILSINIGDYENKIYRGALFKQLSNGLLKQRYPQIFFGVFLNIQDQFIGIHQQAIQVLV